MADFSMPARLLRCLLVLCAISVVACGDGAAPNNSVSAADGADVSAAPDAERGDAADAAPDANAPCIADAASLQAAVLAREPAVTLCTGADLRVALTVNAPLSISATGTAILRGDDAPAITVANGGVLDARGVTFAAPADLVLPAIEVAPGGRVHLEASVLDAGDGIGLRATEAGALSLVDVEVRHDATSLAAAGLLLADSDEVVLERVRVATYGPFGIGLVRSTASLVDVEVSRASAAGIAVEGGELALRGGTITELRTLSDALAFGLVIVDATARIEDLAITGVDGAGALVRRSTLDATGLAVVATTREALVFETSNATLTGVAAVGARRAGIRLAADSEVTLDGAWVAEVQPTTRTARDGDGIVLDDDTTPNTLTVRDLTIYAPARVGLFIAGEGAALGPSVEVEGRTTICTDEARRPDWACEGAPSLACLRTALAAGAAWSCEEDEDGTTCAGDGAASTPDEPSITRNALESCGAEAVRLDPATAAALVRGTGEVPWFAADTATFSGSVAERGSWACTDDACRRDHAEDGPGAARDLPTGGTSPGWTCVQGEASRDCALSAVPFVDRGDQLLDANIALSPSFEAANNALDEASVRPTFVPSSATDLFDYLEALGALVPKGIIGENGPVGRPVPDRCDDGTLRADCECGCIPGGCLAKRTFFEDLDGDGFGRDDVTLEACTTPPRFVGTGGDCSDTDVFSNPITPEVWDARDNDCDGNTDGIGLLELDLYRTVISEFDWVHTYATTAPAGGAAVRGSMSLFPVDVCESPAFRAYDQCDPAPALGVNTEGYAVFLAAGTLTALSECRGVLGVKNVSLYLLETSGEYQGYFGRGELACTRIGYVYTGSLAESLAIGTPVYRLQSGFGDPGKGDNVWVADLLNLPDATYQYLGQPPFYAPAAE